MHRAVVLILVAVFFAAAPLTAQEPATVPLWFAVGIPDGNVPTIDADNSDWAWVDRTFEVTINDMFAIVGGADDADDLFIDTIVGWNESTNRIYVIAHVHDDELIIDVNPTAPWRDDGFETHFDPNNLGGGPYADAESDLQQAYQLCMYFSETFERLWFYSGALGNFGQNANDFWWTHSGDWLEWAQTNEGQEYYWEWSAALFDPLSISGGPEASTRWVLAPEQVIGLSIEISDADPGINTSGNNGADDDCGGSCPNGFFWQAYYSNSEIFNESAGTSDYFLAPVDASSAVEASTWGQIKSLARNSL
jgi:hypothetical protein